MCGPAGRPGRQGGLVIGTRGDGKAYVASFHVKQPSAGRLTFIHLLTYQAKEDFRRLNEHFRLAHAPFRVRDVELAHELLGPFPAWVQGATIPQMFTATKH